MMFDNYDEKALVERINDNINFVKKIPLEDAGKCAGSIRSALEYAVKLFWLKKYDKVWKRGFELNDALIDKKFTAFFSKMTLSYMHTIRQTCNGVLHDNDSITLDEAKDLLEMLEKCVKAIGEAIPMKILTPSMETVINTTPLQEVDQDMIKKHSVNKDSSNAGSNSAYEQTVFWEMFQKALDDNGDPFTILTRAQYGSVNRNRSYCNLCLGFDFLLSKRFFRIGIYVQDDTKTPCFNRLLQQKDEIESALGFTPIWTPRGARNPNTRRIETRLPFTPYDREDYARLINEALPIFIQYIKVFSKYLPEAFKDE